MNDIAVIIVIFIMCCFLLNGELLLGQQVEYAGVKIEDAGHRKNAATYSDNADERKINDTELTYSGNWEFNHLLPRSNGYFCNTRSFAKSEGASASYLFTDCVGFAWHAMPAPNGTKADLYVDGRKFSSIDCAKVGSDGVLFDSGVLKKGSHTLVIVAVSGAVEIDFLVARGKAAGPVRIDVGNRSFIQITAGFKETPTNLKAASSLIETKEPGEEWELYTKGAEVKGFGNTGPDGGIMHLYVNGTKVKDVNFKSSRPESGRLLFELRDLPAERFNAIKGVVGTQGGRISLNYFTTNDPSCLIIEMNRKTDAEIAQMARHERTASVPETWHPISLQARFPVNGVRLEDGVFKTIFDRNIHYLKECLNKPNWVDAKDADRIWIDILYASNEGRMLGGMGHTLRYVDVPEFHKAIDDILEQIDRRQYANGNGYLMPYGSSNYKLSMETWPGIMRDEQKNYDRAMLTKGLLAAGLAGHNKAYQLLRPFYDWFNHAEEYLPIMLLGSMGIQGSIAGAMVYHSLVGMPEDIQTNMKYYDMDWWLHALAQGIPEAAWRFPLNRPHNYLLTSVCALFDIYLATGEMRYLDASLGAWNIYHDYFQIPGGGISLCEHFECKPKSYKLTNLPNNIYETCGSVFWIDLNHRFLQLWPEKESYAAEIEKSLYNVVFAAQAEDGKIRYFNQVNGGKYPSFCYNTCCEIQGTALYGMLPQYIYSIAEDGIYVNQFSASEIQFAQGMDTVRVLMKTRFPYDGTIELQLKSPIPKQMKIRIRIPEWAKQSVWLEVNDKRFMKGKPGRYVSLDRTWKDGDRIILNLPMTWRIEKYMGETRIEGATRYAIFYGPMLMALKGPMMPDVLQAENEPSVKLAMPPEAFLRKIKPTGNLCTFSIDGLPEYSLCPYFSLQEGSFTCFPGFSSPDIPSE